jgi:uncharacterized protein with PIN domain
MTRRAVFRFYAGLNDFLPRARRGVAFVHPFAGSPAVKDAIESLGVPHPEVDLVLADGEPVELGWRLRDGARVSVYPRFESLDVAAVTLVRPAPLADARFALDAHLGRLARHLRMLGFDARWERDVRDDELARIAAEEQRVLLTRDVGVLKRSCVTHGYWVRAHDPVTQLAEVVRRFDLSRSLAPFRRCLRCNGLLEPVAKEAVQERLPPRVRAQRDAFRRCPSCARIYWAGSHTVRMDRLIRSTLAAAQAPERRGAPLSPRDGHVAAGLGPPR